MADRAVQVTISGRVQGVGFRAWVNGEAKRLGLAGWVRNRRDGRVEALFSGDSGAVDDMLVLCRGGPQMASVDDVEATAASGPVGTGFRIAPTV